MRVLAYDPGRTQASFAYAVLDDGIVTRYGLVRPIDSLLHPAFSAERDDFVARILTQHDEMKPDLTVIERFMDRGGGKGVTGEFINIMIGLVGVTISPHTLELVSPSTWKNWLARTYKIGKSTKLRELPTANMLAHIKDHWPSLVPEGRGATRMLVHEGDAIGMVMWKYEKETDKTNTIEHLIDPNRIVKQDI